MSKQSKQSFQGGITGSLLSSLTSHFQWTPLFGLVCDGNGYESQNLGVGGGEDR